MKQILLLLFLFFFSHISFSQSAGCPTPDQNLQKYWVYRERLKDFVLSAGDYGCGMPASGRSGGILEYGDEPLIMGYYIAMLATEYHLLDVYLTTHSSDAASLNQKQNDIEELYYALYAVNRIDIEAEPNWRQYYSGCTSNCSHSNDLNGFMIRDDVHSTFADQMENGDYAQNDLNKGLVPVPDYPDYWPVSGYRITGNNSAFSTSVNTVGKNFNGIGCIFENGRKSGVNTMSIDEISGIYMGLALIAKYVQPSVTYGTNSFQDTYTSIYSEALQIQNRIYNSASSGYIDNPVTFNCGTGVAWAASNSNVTDACKCDAGGSRLVGPFSLPVFDGFVDAGNSIQSGMSTPYAVSSTSTWRLLLASSFMGGNNEFFVLTYAAIGDVWKTIFSDPTPTNISNLALADAAKSSGRSACDHIPLLWDIFWGSPGHIVPYYTSSYYSALINTAPCRGTDYHYKERGNYEWTNGDRLLYGPNKLRTPYSDIAYGLDYLLYFNLYNCAYNALTGSSTPYTTYKYIEPQNLCEQDLIKTSFIEQDEKNFYASNTITAGNVAPNYYGPYTIKNDGDVNQPGILGIARVNFRAGKYDLLVPGFHATYGSYFDASINNTLQAQSCSQCNDVSSSVEANYLPLSSYARIGRERTIDYYSTDTIHTCTSDTLYLRGINGDTHFVAWNWDFGNGQTSTSDTPRVVYRAPVTIDTNTGLMDTTYNLMLIVTDTASHQDTVVTHFIVICNSSPRYAKPTKQDKNLVTTDTTGFKVLNTVTSGSAEISYHLTQQAEVNITVHDLMGNNMGVLVNTVQQAGDYKININEGTLASGMYFVTMCSGNFVQTKKIVIVK